MGYFDFEHPTLLADPVGPRDHLRGATGGRVTVVEYGDFACPHCRAAHGLVQELLARVPQIRFVFRANPRSHLFPHAPLLAEAAEAAGAQGRFWPMHDLLFEQQGVASVEDLLPLARAAQLDVGRFERDLAAGVHRPAVRAQEVSGWRSHVLATPTFFVEGVRLDDGPDALGATIDEVLRTGEQAGHTFREVRVQGADAGRRTDITFGPHRLSGDLGPADGGRDAGPGPYDLLLAALGSCTNLTLRWAAEQRGYPLTGVHIRLSQSRTATGHRFRLAIDLEGDLSEAQRQELQEAAALSPISRTLRGAVQVDCRVSVDRTVEEAGEESFPASDPPAWTLGRDGG